MRIIKHIKKMQSLCRKLRQEGKSIGFVPTMGYLHEGHLSLMRQGKLENDICVISIFVNPMQFGPKEDFKRYPRDFKQDCKLAKDIGVDILFFPDNIQMYPKGFLSEVNVSQISEILCGKSRPGHFKGVTTVVLKLFNITLADIVYFGGKDFQQARIIQMLVRDLNLPIKIKMMPIIRERDGLAMSSRNTYLSRRERGDALILYKSLNEARQLIKAGERGAQPIISTIKNLIASVESATIDYIEIVDAYSLERLSLLKGKVVILLAVKIGKVRLIDNTIIKV